MSTPAHCSLLPECGCNVTGTPPPPPPRCHSFPTTRSHALVSPDQPFLSSADSAAGTRKVTKEPMPLSSSAGPDHAGGFLHICPSCGSARCTEGSGSWAAWECQVPSTHPTEPFCLLASPSEGHPALPARLPHSWSAPGTD